MLTKRGNKRRKKSLKIKISLSKQNIRKNDHGKRLKMLCRQGWIHSGDKDYGSGEPFNPAGNLIHTRGNKTSKDFLVTSFWRFVR